VTEFPLAPVAMTEKLFVPPDLVSTGWPPGTVPLQLTIVVVIPPSLHRNRATIREPRW
jgi:hypothetical protein